MGVKGGLSWIVVIFSYLQQRRGLTLEKPFTIHSLFFFASTRKRSKFTLRRPSLIIVNYIVDVGL